ncbi:MAG: hypothetical protein WBD40_04990 [Tepidisphaeraceae bacterium]
MNMQPPPPTQPSQRTLIDAVRQGEKKKIPLIQALKLTRIDRGNVADFIGAMNEVPGPLAAELIALAWSDLDVECRLCVVREWLDGKDKEQQAGGYHALSARLLISDSGAAMDILDRVAKLAAGSPPCLRRVISTTRSEWVGTTPEQARFQQVDPLNLTTNSRLMLLDWLCDCCPAELRPSDDERRRTELQKHAEARAALVAAWLEQLQTKQLSEPVALAIERSLARLRPKATIVPTAQPARLEIEQPPDTKTSTSPVPTPQRTSTTPPQEAETNDMLREVFSSIRRVFQRESDLHRRELRSVESELVSAKAQLERSERDAAAYRNANAKATERLSELDEEMRGLLDARERTDKELSEAREKLVIVSADLDAERRQKQAFRDESHEAVSRETQRERDRLLAQLGQRIGNIVEGYREIRARGPLPEGTPTMVGDMMDELLSRLEAAGVRFRRE